MAVILNEADQLFLHWNDHWGAFTLPVTKRRLDPSRREKATVLQSDGSGVPTRHRHLIGRGSGSRERR